MAALPDSRPASGFPFLSAAMKKWILFLLLAFTATAQAAATGNTFHFLAMNQPQQANNGKALETAFGKLAQAHPAFVVINGIKSEKEACSDELYYQRKELANSVNLPIIFSLSNADWVNCRNRHGDSLAIERLIRLKQIFFDSADSLGATPLALTRQSLGSRFANYPENAYWLKNPVLFATLHMPSDNNHYLAAAGRNNEFEDRTVANQNWLERLFRIANRHRYKGIVLFSDGNPYTTVQKERAATVQRDGFQEIRQKLDTLASRYPGRVLLIHGQHTSRPGEIVWRGRLGTLGLTSEWIRVDVIPGSPNLFQASNAFGKPGRAKRIIRQKTRQTR